MKKTIISCCLFTVGALSCLVLLITAALNPVISWTDPPGLFMCTLTELGFLFPLQVSGLVTCIGLGFLCMDYFNSK